MLAFGLPPLVRFGFLRGWIPELPTFLSETTWVVALFTIIIFVYLYRSRKATFVQLYLLSMGVKLIAYFAYNLIIILEEPGNAIANVVYFLLVYLVFTALEIVFLYRKITLAPRA